MARGESITSTRRLLAFERQLRVLQLRAQGLTYQRIAEAVGYASRSGAQNAVKRALSRVAAKAPDAVELRLDIERVDALFAPTYKIALSGDLQAVSVCLAIMARRAALLGLDVVLGTDSRMR